MLARTLPVLLLVAGLAASALPVQAMSATPASVDLGAAARALARSADGTLVAFATADGVKAFDAAGHARFTALAGKDVRSVAVDAAGDEVVAGDSLGFVHFLRGDGSEARTGVAVGAVTTLSVSDDGSRAVAGTDQGFAHGFDTAQPLPPPLPGLPADPAGLLLPFWSFDLQAPASGSQMTADGHVAAVGTAGVGTPLYVFLATTGGLLPGGVGAFGRSLPCAPEPVMKCWYWAQWTPGFTLTVLSAARDSFDMVAGWDSSYALYESMANPFYNPWYFKTPTGMSAGVLSADDSHAFFADSRGDVYGVATAARPSSPLNPVPALWSAKVSTKVARLSASASGSVAAAATTGGAVTVFDGATGAVLLISSAGGALVGLSVAPDGASMAGATGSTALFWT